LRFAKGADSGSKYARKYGLTTGIYNCRWGGVLIVADQESVILEHVPHKHLVLSIPKRLRIFFRYDRKLLGVLFDAAWQSILELFHAVLSGYVPGAVLCVQSHGDALNFNPHIHAIVSDGAFSADGTFHPLGGIDPQKLQDLFMHKVLRTLKDKNLIPDFVVEQILSQRNSGFSAWWGDAIEPGDAPQRLFLSRYIDRGPVAESRISITDDIVTYLTPKDDITHEFSPLEFLAQLTPHIPGKWESTTRYFGYYSCRTRGKRNKDNVLTEISADAPIEKRKASRAWAALIKRVYEIDPLVCPKCQGHLRLREFITKDPTIGQLLKILGILTFQTPTPIRGPPQTFIQDPDYLEYLASSD
jgi:hypothetical protein